MSSNMGKWSSAEVAGKAVDVYEPSEPRDESAVLHLHGHGLRMIRDDPVFTRELERHGLRAACPHGGRSWWLDVRCEEFDPVRTPLQFLTDDVVPWIAERWDVTPPRIALTGLCMGGQGVLQLAYRHPLEFPVVAAMCPVIDFQNWYGEEIPLTEMFEDPEAARQETAILQIRPLGWPKHQLIVCDPTDEWFENSERLTSKLRSSGVPFETDFETSAGGHCWEYCQAVAPRVFEFVADRLANC